MNLVESLPKEASELLSEAEKARHYVDGPGAFAFIHPELTRKICSDERLKPLWALVTQSGLDAKGLLCAINQASESRSVDSYAKSERLGDLQKLQSHIAGMTDLFSKYEHLALHESVLEYCSIEELTSLCRDGDISSQYVLEMEESRDRLNLAVNGFGAKFYKNAPTVGALLKELTREFEHTIDTALVQRPNRDGVFVTKFIRAFEAALIVWLGPQSEQLPIEQKALIATVVTGAGDVSRDRYVKTTRTNSPKKT